MTEDAKIAEIHARTMREERLERVITIALLIVAGVVLQVVGAPESIVGGAFGAAAALVRSGTRITALASSGAGALVGAMLGGWLPVSL